MACNSFRPGMHSPTIGWDWTGIPTRQSNDRSFFGAYLPPQLKEKTEPRNYSRDAVRNRRQPEMHDADDAGR
jgi:hypothetical protein